MDTHEKNLREVAERLTATWVNGNQSDVAEELYEYTQIEVAYIVTRMAMIWGPWSLQRLAKTFAAHM